MSAIAKGSRATVAIAGELWKFAITEKPMIMGVGAASQMTRRSSAMPRARASAAGQNDGGNGR